MNWTKLAESRRAERLRHLLVPLMAAAALPIVAQSAHAQNHAPQPPAEFALRHARAADVQPVLRQVLAALPERTDVQADGRANRLFVHGSHEARQLAHQTIQSLDRPAAGGQQPVLKTYGCRADQLAAIAQQIQNDFSAAGTHVSVDRRTSQLLVMAPPATHRLIVGQLGPALSPVEAAGPHEEPHETIVLEHKSWAQIQAALERLWGKPLVSVRSPDSALVSHRLELPSGGSVQVAVDETGKQVHVSGAPAQVSAVVRFIDALDVQPQPEGRQTRVIAVKQSSPESVRRALSAFRFGSEVARPGAAANQVATVLEGGRSAIRPLARLFQEPARATQVAQAQPGQQPPPDEQPPPDIPGTAPPGLAGQFSGLIGEVEVVYIEALDALILIGPEADVQLLEQIIADLEQIPQPTIEVYPLEHVGSAALQEVVGQLYDEVLAARQGPVSITALVKPNALLLIGRAESVAAVKALVSQLDQPVDATTQFEVFRLSHAAAADVQATIEGFYEERAGLGPRVIATADFNTNAVIVQASPRDLVEVRSLIERIDTSDSAAVNDVRIFPLEHTLATDLAPILMQAIYGQAGAAGARTQPGGGGQQQQQGGFQFPGQQNQPAGGQGIQQSGQRSTRLELLVIDNDQQQRYRSGLLNNVTVTADPRTNKLVVSAPAESMELLAALIRQLDQPPAAVAQVKVFALEEGDADALAQLLQQLFGQQAAGGQQAGQPLIVGEGEGSLVPLRFAVDMRTNSIIAAGSEADLAIVEAILFRLDEGDIRQRVTNVYRLKNAPAEDIALTISEYLRSERDVQQVTPGLLTPFEQIEREVVVVPEIVTNSLIISATPRFYKEIEELVRKLDEPPPMVLIKVLIAEVALNDTDEFGVELGLQDSVLFDRSLLGDLLTTSTTTSTSTAQGVVNTTQDLIQAATLTPGFVFNNNPLGNSGSTQALTGSQHVAGQALSHFSVGRVNGELGYGGLVLSASSESVNILIRALQETRRLDVLSRPAVMTLDNQPAFIQVGQRVPRITGVTVDETGQVNSIVQENVGLIVAVTPRVTPDNVVVMEVDAEKSQVGPEAEGIPISINVNGDVIRSPRIDTILAQTTVSVPDQQTVVLGGLIATRKAQTHRRVPLLSSVPVLGHLFRFDSVSQQRTELLIILTPHIVRTEADLELIKQTEASRMSWCLADVHRMHGSAGLDGRLGEWADEETMVYYPDLDPSGELALPPGAEIPPGGPQPPGGELPPGALPNLPGNNAPAVPPPGVQQSAYYQMPHAQVQPVVYQGPPAVVPAPHVVNQSPPPWHQTPQGPPATEAPYVPAAGPYPVNRPMTR